MKTTKQIKGIGWDWAATLGDRAGRVLAALLPLCISDGGYATIEEVEAAIEERKADTEDTWGNVRAYNRLTQDQRRALVAATIAKTVGTRRISLPATDETFAWGQVFGGDVVLNSEEISTTIFEIGATA